ncbi:MAG TPA: DUF2911 domain-containing protein [Longimicrobiales bacterium]
MTGRWCTLGLVLAVAACGAQSQDAVEEGRTTAAATLACAPQAPFEELAERVSPYDSAMVESAGIRAKICYSRPYVKGRKIFGADSTALVPFGKLWRTGANEPTTIHLATAAEIAGIAVEPGSYSLYTVPGESEWTVIVNRSTSQWGHESRYTPEVQAQEVGRATVPAQTIPELVEQFTIRWEPAESGTSLILEWETTRVAIPVTAPAA